MIVRKGLPVVGNDTVRLPYLGDQTGSHQMMQGIVDGGEGNPRLDQVDGIIYLCRGQMHRPRTNYIQDGLTMRSQASGLQSIYRVVHDVSIRPIVASVIVRMILIPLMHAEGIMHGVCNRGATGRRYLTTGRRPDGSGTSLRPPVYSAGTSRVDGRFGSHSAPIFATAFATNTGTHTVFLIGLAAAVGAGISMAFSEALSDDGKLTGRGSPWLRGAITGLMTFLGGLGHTLPFLLANKNTALTAAYLVVGIELLIIAYIRFHYFMMNFFFSVSSDRRGWPVFFAGVKIGSS